MAARLIDGKALAQQIKANLKHRVENLASAGTRPQLVAVMAGDDPAARLYAQQQEKTCREVGIQYRLECAPLADGQDGLVRLVRKLNQDPAVHGLIVQLPVPDGFDVFTVQDAIAPAKDVEGVGPTNLGLLAMGREALVPCTAAAAFACLKSTGAALKGSEAVVIGRSNIVGKPMQMLLMAEHATVAQCHTRTRDRDFHTRRADIVVVAAGRPGTLTGQQIKPGAVVIDVGTNRVSATDDQGRPKKKTVGDCDFQSCRAVCSHITPVPGGVGPVTVAMLLANTVDAAERRR